MVHERLVEAMDILVEVKQKCVTYYNFNFLVCRTLACVICGVFCSKGLLNIGQ